MSDQAFEPKHCRVAHGQQLIVGATGGIGLAWVTHQLTKTQQVCVLAAARQATSHPGLLALKDQYPDRLTLIDVDVTDPTSIEAMAASLQPKSLSMVINATGLLQDTSQGIRPEKRWEDIKLSSLEEVMRVNAWSNALLMPAVFPKMIDHEVAIFAALSARVGSIEDNRIGGWYAYRASKAALNQLIKTASIEAARRQPNLIIAGLHPGTTDTALSKPFQANVPEGKLFSPEFVVSSLLGVLAGLSEQDSGGLYAWDGQAIPY